MTEEPFVSMQVKHDTRKQLKRLKLYLGLRSYDELIKRLIDKEIYDVKTDARKNDLGADTESEQ